MDLPQDENRIRRNVLRGIYGVAIVIGLKYGYDFGNQISGTLMGIVGAVNGALFCAILVGVIAEKLFRARPTAGHDR